MNLYVFPLAWSGGAWSGGTIDLTTYIPVTANKKVLALIGIDTLTATLSVTLGTEVEQAMPDFTTLDAALIATSDSIIRCGAVTLTYQMTVIDATVALIDARPWIEPPASTSSWDPYWVDSVITLPAKKQSHVRFVNVTAGGVLTVLGLLDVY
jgi:hypothetical protein